jgi:hypothetical protein
MTMFKSAVASGSVMGVDRTFNLSSCYSTPICFQNFDLVNKSSTTPPVMLGPTLLHWEGSFYSYHRFVSHL